MYEFQEFNEEIYVFISLAIRVYIFFPQKSCIAFFQESRLFRLEFETGQWDEARDPE